MTQLAIESSAKKPLPMAAMLEQRQASAYKRRVSPWRTSDLVAVGAFAALIRVAGLAIVLAGGAMNPAVMSFRNMAATALLIVLVHKAPRPGVLSLYSLIFGLFSLLLMGSISSLPAILVPAMICDGLFWLFGGYRSTFRIVSAVALYDVMCRALALGFSVLTVRENTGMLIMALMITAFAYVGCLLGLPVGIKLVRELRLAGVIRA